MRGTWGAVLLCVLLSTCSSDARAEAPPASDALDAILDSLDVPAAVFVRRVSDGAEFNGGGARVDARFVPASTFKIPNTLIILGTGVIVDVDRDVIAWDGVERGGAWDQDQTLRSAFRRSAYWAYSHLAQQVGHDRVRSAVIAFGYGDENVGSPQDVGRFWLEGPLTVTAREQVGFLSRLHARSLPVAPEHADLVVDLMEIEVTERGTLRGKTGWGRAEEGPDIGWFVGWFESADDTWIFAMNIDMTDPPRHRALRRTVVEDVLAALGAIER
jgi:beta-lactamase class D